MARWVLTSLKHYPGFTTLRVGATTDAFDYIFMSWALTNPARSPIWRIVRGKRVFCGYTYVWDTPNVTAQVQPGDTQAHSFSVFNLPVGAEVWYYLHAPNPPSPWETQGPLMHAHLLTAPVWADQVYCATRLKGMFRTTDFSGPGGPQPHWTPDNDGLAHLDIRQACPDPWDPYWQRFVIAGGDVYRMHTSMYTGRATATRILALSEAVALTGGSPGRILWITGNQHLPGHFYVLFCSDLFGTGIWSLKTIDYGASWTPHLVRAHAFSYNAGNIQAGDEPALSPYPQGRVLYTTTITGAGGILWPRISLDEGETWAPCLTTPGGISTWEPRLYIEPSDHSIVYLGADTGGPDLFRTLDHGDTWQLCDAGNHLGINVNPDPAYGTIGTYHTEFDNIRVLKDRHIWKSSDFGIIWRDQGETQCATPHMHFRTLAPDFLYLARIANAPIPPPLYARHTIFVSDDEGSNMFGKAGAHADEDDGRYDSIPWNCGGVSQEGIMPLPP